MGLCKSTFSASSLPQEDEVVGLLPAPPVVLGFINEAAEENVLTPAENKVQLKNRVDKALPWLKEALVAAGNDTEVKRAAKELLGVEKFTANLTATGVFNELKAFCASRALELGAEMAAYYSSRALRESLGKFVVPVREMAARRLDDPAVGLPLLPRGDGESVSGWERTMVHMIRLVAISINDEFHDVVRNMVHSWGGEHRAPPVKGFARMVNKVQSWDDHRRGALPRPMLNLDVVRAAATFERVEELFVALDGLAERFGPAIRVKNTFALSEVRAKQNFHYRSLLVNWLYAPECTFGELASRSHPAWERYLRAPPDDPAEPWSRWRRDAARAVAHLRSPEVAPRPVRFVCETQLLLRPYLEGRLKMHLLYKLTRAETSPHLHRDFLTARTAPDATFESWQQQGVQLARARLARPASFMPKGLMVELKPLPVVLGLAARAGHRDAVAMLLREHGGTGVLNADADDEGRTALYKAAFHGHADVVELLLERKAEADREMGNVARDFPLLAAAQQGHLDVLNLLLRMGGASVNHVDHYGVTALCTAALAGHQDIVRSLLGAKADPNRTRDSGFTPAFQAAKRGHIDVLRVLLAEGADPRAACFMGLKFNRDFQCYVQPKEREEVAGLLATLRKKTREKR